MAVAGIIAEYNPFHRGHLYQMASTRELLGPETAIICVMSSNFVQRGEPAQLNKHARAEAAVHCGADLVIELPTPWAAATAETFARGAVSLLNATGVVDYISFGSESGDVEPLRRLAEALDSEDFPAALQKHLTAPGLSFAAARQAAAAELTDSLAAAHLEQPNDILGIEYIRALRHVHSTIRPLAVRRLGAAHDGAPADGIASASSIRQMLLSGEDVSVYLPEPSLAIVRREIDAGSAPASFEPVERAVLARLRTMTEDDFSPYDRGGEGLGNRMYHAVRSASSLQEVLELAKTRRYPMARLRRMILHAWLEIRPDRLPPLPPYIRVLAIGRQGRNLLRRMKPAASLPVVIRPAEASKLSPDAAAVFSLEARCTDLYTLTQPVPAAPGEEYRRSPFILPERKIPE